MASGSVAISAHAKGITICAIIKIAVLIVLRRDCFVPRNDARRNCLSKNNGPQLLAENTRF